MANFETEVSALLNDRLLGRGAADQIGAQSAKLMMFMSDGRTDAGKGKAKPVIRYGKNIVAAKGGVYLRRPLRTARNTARGSVRQLGEIGITPNRKYDAAQFAFATYYGSITWSDEDFNRYRQPEAYIDKLDEDVAGVFADMKYDLAVGINNVLADQVGFQSEGLDGTGFMFDNSGSAWGGISARTGANSFFAAGLDATSYSTANQEDPTSPYYLLTLIDQAFNAVFNNSSVALTDAFCSAATFTRLHNILRAEQRHVNVVDGKFGYRSINYRGIDFHQDPMFAGTTRMEFYAPDGFDDERTLGLVGREGYFFQLQDWKTLPSQLGKTRQLVASVALYCDQPRMQYSFTGIAQ